MQPNKIAVLDNLLHTLRGNISLIVSSSLQNNINDTNNQAREIIALIYIYIRLSPL